MSRGIVIEEDGFDISNSSHFSYYILFPLLLLPCILVIFIGLFKKQIFVLLGLLWLMLWLGLFVLFGFQYEWFPETADRVCTDVSEDGICFCEAYVVNSTILQPAATVSDLAFIFFGLLICYLGSSNGFARFNDVRETENSRESNANPFAIKNSPIVLVYALIVIFMGPGSMFFHASIKLWAGYMDAMSIVLWLGFSLVYRFSRVFRKRIGANRQLLVLVYVVLMIVSGTALVYNVPPIVFHVGLSTLLGFLEVFVYYRAKQNEEWPGIDQDFRLIVGVIAVFAIAMGIWLPSGGVTNVLCPGYSPHMLWHIIASSITFLFYLYFKSEKPLLAVKGEKLQTTFADMEPFP